MEIKIKVETNIIETKIISKRKMYQKYFIEVVV